MNNPTFFNEMVNVNEIKVLTFTKLTLISLHEKKLKLTLYTKDHEKLFCVIADKKNCEHLSYKGLFCTISPPKSLKDRSLHSEYKQRPLFFTFVVNPKKKKLQLLSLSVYNCRHWPSPPNTLYVCC